ncbi:MAG: hypothetical protein ACK56I_10995, partial [bacterium]
RGGIETQLGRQDQLRGPNTRAGCHGGGHIHAIRAVGQHHGHRDEVIAIVEQKTVPGYRSGKSVGGGRRRKRRGLNQAVGCRPVGVGNRPKPRLAPARDRVGRGTFERNNRPVGLADRQTVVRPGE